MTRAAGSERNRRGGSARAGLVALLVAVTFGVTSAAAPQEGGATAVSPLEEGLAEKTATEVPAVPPLPEVTAPPPPAAATAEPDLPTPAAGPEEELPQPAIGAAPAVIARPLDGFERLRVPFAEQSAELGEDAKLDLLALADYMTRDAALRVQLTAYARSDQPIASFARRLSLSRALAVRAFLVDKGVEQTRIDLRPLGSETEYEPTDLVDILPSPR